MPIAHLKVSTKPDSQDPSLIQPSDWNAGHSFTGENPGILFTESSVAQIDSVSAGINYLYYLRRKFNANVAEQYEFAKVLVNNSADYEFLFILGSINLLAGVQTTVTISPVPLGVNGFNSNHWLYIFDGVDGDEVVRIEGGTALAGAGTGNLIIRPTKNHSVGNWYLGSATAGIQEAIMAISGEGGVVTIPPGIHTCRGPIVITRGGIVISGTGNSWLYVDTNTCKVPFIQLGAVGFPGHYNRLQHFGIQSNNKDIVIHGIHVVEQHLFTMRDIEVFNFNSGILIQPAGITSAVFENLSITQLGIAGVGIEINGGTGWNLSNCWIDAGNNAATGILVKGGGNLRLSNVSVRMCTNGLHVQPPNNGGVSSLSVVNSSFYDCLYSGIFLDGTNQNTRIVGSVFSNVTVTNNQEDGVIMLTANGFVHNTTFSNCVVATNRHNGFLIAGTKNKYLNISNCHIVDNSADASNAWYGIDNQDGAQCIFHGNTIVCGDALNPVSPVAYKYKACIHNGISASYIQSTDNILGGSVDVGLVFSETQSYAHWHHNIQNNIQGTFYNTTQGGTIVLPRNGSNRIFITAPLTINAINNWSVDQTIHIHNESAGVVTLTGGGNIKSTLLPITLNPDMTVTLAYYSSLGASSEGWHVVGQAS